MQSLKKIKEMVSEKKLPKGTAVELLSCSWQPEDEMIKIAEKLSIMPPAQRKDVLKYIKTNRDTTAEEIEEELTAESENELLSIVLTFSPTVSKAINDECSKRGEEPGVFVNSLVVGHLEKKGLLKE